MKSKRSKINTMKKALIVLALIAFTTLSAAQGSSVQLETDLVTKEPTPLQAGEYANVWIELQNNGSATANDVELEFEENYPFKIEEGERKRWSFDSLRRGEERQVRMQVRVDNKAVQGENNLKLRTTTRNGVGIEHRIPVQVRVDDTSLVVQDVDFPERVPPGSTNTMEIKLENLANGHFRNVDINANIENEDLAAIGSSRQRVQLMDPVSTDTVEFDINVDEDADNGVYRVPLDFSYQNEVGDTIETSQTAGLVVGGEPELDVGIEDSDIRTAGVRDSVTFNIINKGDGQASFVDFHLQDSEEFEVLSENSEYLGSMISDDYQTAEFDVYVNEGVESLSFPVTLEYRNEEGERTNQTVEVERRLFTGDELDRFGLSESSASTILFPLLVLGVVGGVYYWRKRRNGKPEIELN